MLHSELAKERFHRRHCFLKLLSAIRFLARQGLPFRRDGNEGDLNFSQLFRLLSQEDERLRQWMDRKTSKYTSGEMQNEAVKTMAHCVLRTIASRLQDTPFFTVMVDETADNSNVEQVVMCLRSVDDTFEVYEDFVGLYEVPAIDAQHIYQVIVDVFQRLNLSMSKLRGQCYDGASAMSGAKTGVARRVQTMEPRALFTHCYGHSLNLACSDTIKQSKLMRDALETTHEITKLVKKSPRREAIFRHLKEDVAPGSLTPLSNKVDCSS